MPRQYLAPGWGTLSETGARQYLVPGWGYVHETQLAGSVGTAAGTSAAAASGVAAGVGTGTASATSAAAGAVPGNTSPAAAAGTSSAAAVGRALAASPPASAEGSSAAAATPVAADLHSDVTAYLIPGFGYANETTGRQYLVPGLGHLNETQVTGYSGRAVGTSSAAAAGLALVRTAALAQGTSSAAAGGAVAASAAGAATGTSAATGDGTAVLSRPAVCYTAGDYFTYINLDRRPDSPYGVGAASGTSAATAAGAALAISAGTAAGTSAAVAGTSGSVVTGTGLAAGTSTAAATGTSVAPRTLVLPGAPLFVYSDLRPAGYTGNTFRIRRESDGAEFDIGFKADDTANYAQADALAPLGWRRVTQYDLSGNGYHITVPATVQAPKNFGNTVAGLRSLSFNGPGTTQALANLSVPVTNVRNVTVMAILKNAGRGIFELGNPTWKMILAGSLDAGINWSGTQAQYAVTSPQVMLAVGNGAGSRVLKQNHRVTTAAALPSGPATGLTLGNVVAYTGAGNSDFLCLVGYDATLSAPDQTALVDAAYAAVPEIPRAARDVIAAHGDSLVEGNSRGADVSYETLWFSRLMAATSRPYTWYNCGHGGYTAATLAAVAPAVAAACYDPLGTNSVIFAAGSNDLAFGATAAQAYASIALACQRWRAAGFTRVHVIDVIPRKAIFTNGVTAASFEAQRQLLLPMIAAGVGTDFDSASSPGTHPVLGDPANCTATYYSDLVHLNPLGNQIYAALVDADTAAWRN